MSGKKSTDLAIQGRRLRPVYDALDSGQNKKAIQEADKVLKKHPQTHAAKALKALALIRMERTAVAFELVSALEEEIKAGSYDENFIQAVCHCYKEGFMPERIVTLYELLVKKFPNDENILSQLFLAHVRVGNYKEQQRIAMQLYKDFNATSYLMWSIMSLIMQGMENNEIGKSMFYPLAEKMMNKAMEGYTFKGEEADLYLMILELRGKIGDAIKYVESSPTLNENLIYGTKAYHCLNRLYFLNRNFETLIERARQCLEKDCNDWTSWQFFLDSYFYLIEDAAAKDSSFENLKPLFERLINSCVELGPQGELNLHRGPILAYLEITNRLKRCQHIIQEQIEQLPNLKHPIEYMKLLIECSHNKPYCFTDVKLYLHLLVFDDYDTLIKHTNSLCPEIKDGDDSKVNKEILQVGRDWNDLLREELVWSRISHDKTSLSQEERRSHVRELFRKLPPPHFQAGQVASVYGSLIAGYLLESGKSNIPLENVLTMIVIFEHIRRTYADCDRSVLVLLARLYTIVGDVSRVADLCRQLDIKYIQRDSLGFMQFFLAERFGRFRTAIFFYTSISTQYDQGEREIAECSVNAYRNGSFSQITKFVDFQKKCVHSIYSTTTDVMNRALSSIFGVDSLDVAGSTILGDDGNIEWENLCDNRDFAIVSGVPCDCCAGHMEEIKEKSFKEMVIAMKLQHHFCRTIGILSSKNISAKSFQTEYDAFQKHFKEAKKFTEENKEKKLAISNFSYLNMMETLDNGYFDISFFVFDVVKTILNKAEGTSTDDLPDVNKLASILNDVITSKMPEKAEEMHLGKFVEFLEVCASSLKTLVSCLLAIKFVERRAGDNSQENGLKISAQIVGELSRYENEIVEALKKVRSALSLYLSALDAELNADASSGQREPTVVSFPAISFDVFLDTKDESDDAVKMRKMLADLKHDIEMSIKNSYIQGIQESLGVLFRADTKLLASSTNSLLKWPKLLVDSLAKLNI